MKPAPLAALAITLAVSGCCRKMAATVPLHNARLQKIAQYDHQWTGVTLSHSGRIFVNFPRWKDWPGMSVAEVKHPGGLELGNPADLIKPVAFPDEAWQKWSPGDDPKTHFVCVQSVVVDDQDFLWVVDAAGPDMKEIVPGGPKLVKIDLKTNAVVDTYFYDEPQISKKSYLNDVRVDTARQIAYLTDSGTGGILVTDLKTHKNHRVLGDSPTTRSEGIDVVIDGKPWRRDGEKPEVHADGIALSPDGKWLYYHALTGETLYRIKTEHLNGAPYSGNELPRDIETLGKTGPCDGMFVGPGGSIYLTGIATHSVQRWSPGGHLETVIQSSELQWPDTFSVGPDGALYVTTSQIDTQPHPPGPYKLFKLVR